MASAESLPYSAAAFDLLSVGLAFHWFDQEPFLREARRVLRSYGWLAIYNIAFRGVLVEHPEFAAWYRNAFLRRFPNPPRNSRPITAEGMASHGFQLAAQDVWRAAVPFTPTQFVKYLLSQSNVTVAVDQTDLSFEQVEAWIWSETAAWFAIEPVTADFQIDLSLLRPSTSP